MRRTALDTLRSVLRDRPSSRWHSERAKLQTPEDSESSETLVADGGARGESVDDAHVNAVPDGAGCTEIWEHLSERRDGDVDDDA